MLDDGGIDVIGGRGCENDVWVSAAGVPMLCLAAAGSLMKPDELERASNRSVMPPASRSEIARPGMQSTSAPIKPRMREREGRGGDPELSEARQVASNQRCSREEREIECFEPRNGETLTSEQHNPR